MYLTRLIYCLPPLFPETGKAGAAYPKRITPAPKNPLSKSHTRRHKHLSPAANQMPQPQAGNHGLLNPFHLTGIQVPYVFL